MAALEGAINALAIDSEPAPAPTLLDALAHAPGAAALVVAALERAEDRKALRRAHPQLRDAVGEETVKLEANFAAAALAARPPTPRRWPRLEELTLRKFSFASLEALGSETWGGLRSLSLYGIRKEMGLSSARALAAALRRMPALRALELRRVVVCAERAGGELFSADVAPRLRALTLRTLSARSLRLMELDLLVQTGWPLEELHLRVDPGIVPAGVAALVAAPTFAIRRLSLTHCFLRAPALLSIADAPWPLEELDLSYNDLSTTAAGPALEALSRHAGLRSLNLQGCSLNAASFKALVEAAWPALTSLKAPGANVDFAGPYALELDGPAFAGFPALEELDLSGVPLGEVGMWLLGTRPWEHLKKLDLRDARLDVPSAAVLASREWAALEVLDLRGNRLGWVLTFEVPRLWSPELVVLQ